MNTYKSNENYKHEKYKLKYRLLKQQLMTGGNSDDEEKKVIPNGAAGEPPVPDSVASTIGTLPTMSSYKTMSFEPFIKGSDKVYIVDDKTYFNIHDIITVKQDLFSFDLDVDFDCNIDNDRDEHVDVEPIADTIKEIIEFLDHYIASFYSRIQNYGTHFFKHLEDKEIIKNVMLNKSYLNKSIILPGEGYFILSDFIEKCKIPMNYLDYIEKKYNFINNLIKVKYYEKFVNTLKIKEYSIDDIKKISYHYYIINDIIHKNNDSISEFITSKEKEIFEKNNIKKRDYYDINNYYDSNVTLELIDRHITYYNNYEIIKTAKIKEYKKNPRIINFLKAEYKNSGLPIYRINTKIVKYNPRNYEHNSFHGKIPINSYITFDASKSIPSMEDSKYYQLQGKINYRMGPSTENFYFVLNNTEPNLFYYTEDGSQVNIKKLSEPYNISLKDLIQNVCRCRGTYFLTDYSLPLYVEIPDDRFVVFPPEPDFVLTLDDVLALALIKPFDIMTE